MPFILCIKSKVGICKMDSSIIHILALSWSLRWSDVQCSTPREGVIIKWPLNDLFNDSRDVIEIMMTKELVISKILLMG